MKYISILTINLLLLAMMITSGCSSSEYGKSNQMSSHARSYLQKAAASSGHEKQEYQVLAAKQLLSDDDVSDAQQVLKTLEHTRLENTLEQQKLILTAQLALKQNAPRLAIKRLRKIQPINKLPLEIQSIYYQTAYEAYLQSNRLAQSTIARIHFDAILQQLSQKNALPTLDKKTISIQSTVIWRDLQTLPLNTLNHFIKSKQSNLVNGWFQLAIIAKRYANNPTQLITAIKQWQRTYSKHPANNIIPNDEQLAQASQHQPPQHIALLLPLTGKYARTGQAVRDGFLTSFYNKKDATSLRTTIKIHDTHTSNDINSLYQQAIEEGAEFIIGPLTKNNVSALANNTEIKVPTIVLNYLPENNILSKNLIQFGLSPTQAATQAAQKSWRLGRTHLLVISADTDWAEKIKQHFIKAWGAQGGEISDAITFTSHKQLAKAISSALHTDQSKERALQLKHVLYRKIKATIRRRQDINGIFLVASPQQARQIQPLLKFYFAGNLPVISISNIYSGYKNPRKDRDLNGIYFNDMPWVLSNDPNINQLKQPIKKLWPSSANTQSRFYALGIDTFTLSLLLPRLNALPNFAINGVTGQLYLTDQHRVYRQLLWARFSRGLPRLTGP